MTASTADNPSLPYLYIDPGSENTTQIYNCGVDSANFTGDENIREYIDQGVCA
jgi:hypothetical protein